MLAYAVEYSFGTRSLVNRVATRSLVSVGAGSSPEAPVSPVQPVQPDVPAEPVDRGRAALAGVGGAGLGAGGAGFAGPAGPAGRAGRTGGPGADRRAGRAGRVGADPPGLGPAPGLRGHPRAGRAPGAVGQHVRVRAGRVPGRGDRVASRAGAATRLAAPGPLRDPRARAAARHRRDAALHEDRAAGPGAELVLAEDPRDGGDHRVGDVPGRGRGGGDDTGPDRG